MVKVQRYPIRLHKNLQKQNRKQGITIPAAINKAMEEDPKLHGHVLEVQPSNYWPELHVTNKHFLAKTTFPSMQIKP